VRRVHLASVRAGAGLRHLDLSTSSIFTLADRDYRGRRSACKEPFVNAADLMTREVVTLAEDATLGEAMALFSEHGVRHLPILRGKKPIGVISDRDLRRLEGAMAADLGSIPPSPSDRFDAPVSSILEGEPMTVRAETSIAALIDTMLDAHVSAVLVVDAKGALVGIVTSVDVLRAARDRF